MRAGSSRDSNSDSKALQSPTAINNVLSILKVRDGSKGTVDDNTELEIVGTLAAQ